MVYDRFWIDEKFSIMTAYYNRVYCILSIVYMYSIHTCSRHFNACRRIDWSNLVYGKRSLLCNYIYYIQRKGIVREHKYSSGIESAKGSQQQIEKACWQNIMYCRLNYIIKSHYITTTDEQYWQNFSCHFCWCRSVIHLLLIFWLVFGEFLY